MGPASHAVADYRADEANPAAASAATINPRSTTPGRVGSLRTATIATPPL